MTGMAFRLRLAVDVLGHLEIEWATLKRVLQKLCDRQARNEQGRRSAAVVWLSIKACANDVRDFLLIDAKTIIDHCDR